MDIPNNITQVGEWDPKCKIYVEDYVVSYMRQLNFYARNKEMAVALYGVRKEEEEKTYLFIFGAGKLDLLQKDTRHLSQAQKQEIERIRRKYFQDYEFQGYRLLNGEPVDGFHVCEQEVCRFVSGYAQFYEKNESMLTYMLEVRNEEPKPEVVKEEKLMEVRKKQEERKQAEQEEPKADKHPEPDKPTGISKYILVGGACILAMGLLGKNIGIQGLEKVPQMMRSICEDLLEQKLPDTVETVTQSIQVDSTKSGGTDIEVSRLTENAGGLVQSREALEESGKKADKEAEAGTTLQTAEEISGMTLQTTEENPGINSQTTEGNPGMTLQTTEENPGMTLQTTEENPGMNSQTTEENPGMTLQTAEENPGMTLQMPEGKMREKEEIQETVEKSEEIPTTAATDAGIEENYTIEEGDTLTGICMKKYGDYNSVNKVCEANHIDNPDEIKIGQKILLP